MRKPVIARGTRVFVYPRFSALRRHEPAQDGCNCRLKLGVFLCCFQAVHELFADEAFHRIDGAELVLYASRCFALLNPDFVKVQ